MKKIMALLLAMVMTMSLVVPALAADFTDVNGSHQYYTAIQSLVARGIINGYEDNTFRPESTITRAEFCKMVIYSIGMGNFATTGTAAGFSDVAAEHWASGVIKLAVDQEIVTGYDDGTFRPENPVTYYEAIKMAVCAKSSVLKNMAKNDFPNGYVRVATGYGMLKGITDGVGNQPAKRGTIAQLMNNMLKVDLSESLGEDLPVVGESKLEEADAQVLAVYGASVEDPVDAAKDKLGKNEIKVYLEDEDEEKIFNVKELSNKDSLASYLGKKVVLFYEEEYGVDVPVLSSMTEQKGRNDEFTLGIEEISDYDNKAVWYYDEDDDEKKISISSDVTIIYNGTYYDDTSFKTLIDNNIDQAGSIRFLRSEGEDSSVDYIFFTSYRNMFVTAVSSTTKTVTGNYSEEEKGQKIVLDEEDSKKSISIIKDGQSVGFGSIAKNQILSVSESADSSKIEVLISSEIASGSVTAMTRDEKKLTLKGKTYYFAEDLEFGSDIEVGSYLRLYIDAFGKVAKYTFETASVNYNYGYLMAMEDNGDLLSSDVRMYLLNLNSTSNKSITELQLANKVTINGKSYTTGTDYEEIKALFLETAQYYEYEDGYDFTEEEFYQPIKYTLSGGKVNTILIGKQDVEANDGDLKIDRSALDSEDGILCTTANSVLSSIYRLSSTKVVYIPEEAEDRDDVTKYVIRTGTNSGFVKNSRYRVLLVDVNKSNVPALVIVYGVAGVSSTEWLSNLPMVVEKKGEVEEGYEITLRGTGSSQVYFDEEGSFYDDVKIGDVVRVSADKEKKVEAYEITARATDIYNGTDFVYAETMEGRTMKKIGKNGSTYWLIREGSKIDQDDAEFSIMAGSVYSIEENTLLIAFDYAEEGEEWTTQGLGDDSKLTTMNLSSTVVLAVDHKSGVAKNVSVIDADELISYVDGAEDASKVFVYRAGSSAKLIVVYRD